MIYETCKLNDEIARPKMSWSLYLLPSNLNFEPKTPRSSFKKILISIKTLQKSYIDKIGDKKDKRKSRNYVLTQNFNLPRLLHATLSSHQSPCTFKKDWAPVLFFCTRKNKMAATSVPLHHPSSNADNSYETYPDEFAFTSPTTQDASLYSGAIETEKSGAENVEKEDQNGGSSSIYSQILSRKGYEWLLEVDESDDDDFNKPLLWVILKYIDIVFCMLNYMYVFLVKNNSWFWKKKRRHFVDRFPNIQYSWH